MHRVPVAAVAVAVGIAFVTPSSARADAPAVSAADKETGRALYIEGMGKLDSHDYVGAERVCRGAHAIAPVPTAAMCLARALVGLGRLVEARDFLVEAARFPTKTDEPAVFTGARQAAQGEADQLAKRIPTVTLIVSGPDATAPLHVTVDGAVVAPETVRLARKLDPGRHTIIVAASGFAPTTTTVELSEGTDRSVQVSLSPGAPREAVNVAAAPQSTQPQTGAANGSKGVPVLALAVGGVGVAGIVVGAATALAATSTHSKLQGECTGSMCPSSAQGDLDAFHTQRTISGVGYVVGALGIVGGATIWFVTPSRPSESSARLWIGPTSASLRGTF